jgi:iron complex outermembrane receptor protein
MGPAAGDGYAGIGSYGSAELSAGYGEEKGRGGWRIAADGGMSDGDFPFWDNNGTPNDLTDDGVSPRVNDDFTSGHVLARGHLKAADTSLTFEADAFRRDQGVPGIDAVQSDQARLENARLLLAARAERAGLLSGRLVLHGGLTRHDESEEYDGGGSTAFFARSSDNRYVSTGLSGGGTLVAGSRQALAFLVSLRDETADLRDPSPAPAGGRIASVERRILAATLEDQIVLAAGRVQVVPSLRYEQLASDYAPGPASGVVPDEDLDAAATTGRVGARWDISSSWSLRGNAGNYHRNPDVTELYGHRGAVIGNPGLLPERGTNADLGLTWQAIHAIGWFRTLRVEGVLFGTDAQDLIVYEPIPTGAVVARNFSAARIRGFELSLQANLGAHLTGSLNAVRQEAIETGDTFRENSPLPGRSEIEASSALGAVFGRTRLAWNFTYVGPNNISTVGSEDGLPARSLHDVSCRVLLPHRLEATVEVRNLLDDHGVDLYRYPLPGRRYFARLAWSF